MSPPALGRVNMFTAVALKLKEVYKEGEKAKLVKSGDISRIPFTLSAWFTTVKHFMSHSN